MCLFVCWRGDKDGVGAGYYEIIFYLVIKDGIEAVNIHVYNEQAW